MIATPRPLTYDDLVAMPDDGQRYEIIEGELIAYPPSTAGHQRILGRLLRVLGNFERETGQGEVMLAPFDVVLGRHDVVKPDLLFIGSEQGRVSGDDIKFQGVPDLVVEVCSSTSRRIDLVRKMALYARSGVPEYWIADPERRILVINKLQGEEYVPVAPDDGGWIASPGLAGLRVDSSMIFTGLDEMH